MPSPKISALRARRMPSATPSTTSPHLLARLQPQASAGEKRLKSSTLPYLTHPLSTITSSLPSIQKRKASSSVSAGRTSSATAYLRSQKPQIQAIIRSLAVFLSPKVSLFTPSFLLLNFPTSKTQAQGTTSQESLLTPTAATSYRKWETVLATR